MIAASPLRRVTLPGIRAGDYGRKHKSRNGSGGGNLAGFYRRLRPSSTSTIPRSNTLSVAAHADGATPAHRPTEAGVTNPATGRDITALLAAAAANSRVSDRAMRVFTVVATTYDRGTTAAAVAANLPSVTEGQASRLLGALVRAGLLEKRLRTVGYNADQTRIRRSFYTLAGGEA